MAVHGPISRAESLLLVAALLLALSVGPSAAQSQFQCGAQMTPGHHASIGAVMNTTVLDVAPDQSSQPVYSVAFDPSNGNRLASGQDSDNTVKVWDVSTGACVATLEGHDDKVQSVAFSPTGDRLASGSLDGKVKVWDVSTWDCVATLVYQSVYSVAFDPSDGNRLAVGYQSGIVKVWDVSTGDTDGNSDTLVTLDTFSSDGVTGHTQVVSSVAFDPSDGNRLASASWDHKVKLWDISTASCVATLEGHNWKVFSVAFDPTGERLASGSGGSGLDKVKVWDTSNGNCVATLQSYLEGDVLSVAFDPLDGNRLASACERVVIWDVSTQSCVTVTESLGQVHSLSFYTSDADQLAPGSRRSYRLAGSTRYDINVWDLDIDECATDDDNNCHANADCTNTAGSFTCACSSGYEGDGISTCTPPPPPPAPEGTSNASTLHVVGLGLLYCLAFLSWMM